MILLIRSLGNVLFLLGCFVDDNNANLAIFGLKGINNDLSPGIVISLRSLPHKNTARTFTMINTRQIRIQPVNIQAKKFSLTEVCANDDGIFFK